MRERDDLEVEKLIQIVSSSLLSSHSLLPDNHFSDMSSSIQQATGFGGASGASGPPAELGYHSQPSSPSESKGLGSVALFCCRCVGRLTLFVGLHSHRLCLD